MVSGAALRAGAGMVVTTSPGSKPLQLGMEVVQRPLGVDHLVAGVLGDLSRFGCLVVGPGLGTDGDLLAAVAELATRAEVPLVLDADGLRILSEVPDLGRRRAAPTLLTPHDGEFTRIAGEPPGSDRLASVVELAEGSGCAVLLKGPTTVISTGADVVRLVAEGDQRLATAGSGDVLAGVIGAFVARGCAPVDAATAGAHVHGRAGGLLPLDGAVAGDLFGTLGPAISQICRRDDS